LTPAANVTLERPSGTSAAIARPSVGAAAASSAEAPKPTAAATSRRSLTRPRAPVASAPITEPTAIETASAV
jgi:hypothetical protein